MESISSIAANRFLIKTQKNAFYCSVSLVEAFSRYNSILYSGISYSSFYKYVGDEFKKPHRFSDLCEYCENNKVILVDFYYNGSFLISDSFICQCCFFTIAIPWGCGRGKKIPRYLVFYKVVKKVKELKNRAIYLFIKKLKQELKMYLTRLAFNMDGIEDHDKISVFLKAHASIDVISM